MCVRYLGKGPSTIDAENLIEQAEKYKRPENFVTSSTNASLVEAELSEREGHLEQHHNSTLLPSEDTWKTFDYSYMHSKKKRKK